MRTGEKMEDKSYIERLMEFGLTRQEAGIYGCLISEGKTTGYEVAKQLGISRSNAYNSLASMTEKGAAYLVEEAQRWLKKHMPSERDHVEGYITIEGSSNILDKIRNLLAKAEERVYISCTRNYLLLFVDELESLIRAKKKVVIVTDQPVNFRNARVYMGNNRGMQIGVITDSRYVLTGEYGEGSINTCLYSGQKNFVELYKSALSNEIKLLAIREENMQ